ncbi:hypothetical protein DRQ07_10135 [candidate division KSB1 bacterium]|nr:MAG: hypothetical protein DRQ07_10135 [candidate division KSB1 bacterium]
MAGNKIRVLLKEGALRTLGLFLIMKSIKTYSIAMGRFPDLSRALPNHLVMGQLIIGKLRGIHTGLNI